MIYVLSELSRIGILTIMHASIYGKRIYGRRLGCQVWWSFLAEFGVCTTRSFTLIPLELLFVSLPNLTSTLLQVTCE
jgi:hypothetical protein